MNYANFKAKVLRNLQDTGSTNFASADVDDAISDALRETTRHIPRIRRESFNIESRTGRSTSTSTGNLVDSNAPFSSSDVGKEIHNVTDQTWAVIISYSSTSQVGLSKDIMASGEYYEIFNPGCTENTQLNISNITDRLEGEEGIDHLEYPRGTKRNFTIDGDILTIIVDSVEDSQPVTSGLTQPNTEVLVWFKVKHKISQLTDLAGAVNLLAGYSAGATSMVLDGLQSTGTIEAEQEFTIANTRGTYRVTADATISGNAATISFYPPLESDVTNDTVVTFTGSTLTPSLEPLVAQLAAGLCAITEVMTLYQQSEAAITSVTLCTDAIAKIDAIAVRAISDIQSGRTEAAKVSAILDTANIEVDKIGARLTQMVTDIGSGRTELSDSPTALNAAKTALDAMAARVTAALADYALGKTEADKVAAIIALADAELDKIDAQINLSLTATTNGKTEADKMAAAITAAGTATSGVAARVTQGITDIGSARTAVGLGLTAITEADAEFDLMNAEVDDADTALTSANSLNNTVTDGGGAADFQNQAAAKIGAGNARATNGQIYLQKSSADFSNAGSDLGLASGEINAGLAKVREAQAKLEEAQADAAANQALLNNALGSLRNAQEYFRSSQGYFQEGTAEENLNSAYLALGSKELEAGISKLREAQGYIEESNAHTAINTSYINTCIAELRAAGGYLQEAQGYVMEANTRLSANNGLLGDARTELSVAQTRMQEGRSSLEKAAHQLQIMRAGQVMESWGRNQETDAVRKISALAPVKNRTSHVYARS